MTMKWFGESWGAPMCKECPQVPAPVGELCQWCDEPIVAGEQGVIYSNGPAAHLNCFLRGIYGSVAHIEGRCSCYVPGVCINDPEGMTKRQGADAAVEAFERKHRKPPEAAMNEIGRELKASDLKPKTVVVVQPPGKDMFMTVWVREVSGRLVEFYAGDLRWHILNFVQPDGSLIDDKGRTVHVFEYLGEI